MRMRFCYLNCHEAILCCYLVIHIHTTSITAVLLWFVTYLLTLPRTCCLVTYTRRTFTVRVLVP
jgi:hypothetical protein